MNGEVIIYIVRVDLGQIVCINAIIVGIMLMQLSYNDMPIIISRNSL
jgi:hypothetical protein